MIALPYATLLRHHRAIINGFDSSYFSPIFGEFQTLEGKKNAEINPNANFSEYYVVRLTLDLFNSLTWMRNLLSHFWERWYFFSRKQSKTFEKQSGPLIMALIIEAYPISSSRA